MTTSRKFALVTGASSRIGRATAIQLADHGWRVRGASRRDSTVKGRIAGFILDVRDPVALAATVLFWL